MSENSEGGAQGLKKINAETRYKKCSTRKTNETSSVAASLDDIVATQQSVETMAHQSQRTKDKRLNSMHSETESAVNTEYKKASNPGIRQHKNPKISKTRNSLAMNLNTSKKKKQCQVLVQMPSCSSKSEVGIEQYLRHCLQNMHFRLASHVYVRKDAENRGTNNSFIEATLMFDSHHLGKRAVHFLNKTSNTTKIVAKLSGEEYPDTQDQFSSMIELQLKEIQNKAGSIITKHQDKMDDYTERIKSLRVRRHIGLDEYQMISDERDALTHKLEELKAQQEEYVRFMAAITHRMTQLKNDKYLRSNIAEMRKCFGRECLKLDAALPMYAKRTEIVETVMKHQACVVLGETGSGKSTQMSQYLYQTGFAKEGIIVCTQPRKVAALSLAQHVAKEMGCNVGAEVGYKVGLSAKLSKQTSILYVTDHMLLNECITDPTLSRYACIIIDEAHERSIFTDLLLGMIKECLKKRSNLKVIVTSATIQPDVFVEYFGGIDKCPVVRVTGRMFPVEIVWREEQDELDDYLKEAVFTAKSVHLEEPPGDILVFLTTPIETERACDMLMRDTGVADSLVCLQLHGRLQSDEQQKVFAPAPDGKRKVVFATNSAETSITITGIKYVIDIGLAKEKHYDAKKNMSALSVVLISRSSAIQRKGRAGRTEPGKCYRLYSESTYDSMREIVQPELLRSHLGQSLLKLLLLGIDDPLKFDYVEAPPREALDVAMGSLEELGATENGKLTEMGKKMAQLSLEPRLAKLVLLSIERGIGFEALVIAGIGAAGGNIFFRSGSNEEKATADKQKAKFCHPCGDVLTVLNVYKEWNAIPEREKSKWCVSNYINAKSMRTARDTVTELKKTLTSEISITLKHGFHSEERKVEQDLTEILMLTFSANIAIFMGHRNAGYWSRNNDIATHMHPSSALQVFGVPPKWVVYANILETSRKFMIDVTVVKEDVLNYMIEIGSINADVLELENKKLSSKLLPGIGSEVIKNIIGPRYSNLKQIEENIKEHCHNSMIFIDPLRQRGEVEIFADSNITKAFEMLQSFIEPPKLCLHQERMEWSLGEMKIVCSNGAEVLHVMMPGEFCSIFLRNIPDTYTEAEVVNLFDEAEEIVDCVRFHKRKAGGVWGKVTFSNPNAANNVMKRGIEGVHLTTDQHKTKDSNFQHMKIKFSWCRRRPKGFAFVKPANPEDFVMISSRLPIHSRLLIGEQLTYVKIGNKNPNEFFVSKLNADVKVADFSEAFSELVGRHIEMEKVSIPRVDAGPVSRDVLDAWKQRLSLKFMNHASSGAFRIHVFDVKPKDFYVNGYATFQDPEEGYAVFQAMNKVEFVDCNRLEMNIDVSVAFRLLKSIYDAVEPQFAEKVVRLQQENRSVKIQIKQLKSDNYVIDIFADDLEDAIKVRQQLQDLAQGDLIDTGSLNALDMFMGTLGRQTLEKIMRRTKVFIQLDRHDQSVRIYGTDDRKNKARAEFDTLIHDWHNLLTWTVDLRGPGRPSGFMKAILLEHNTNPSQLQKKLDVFYLHVDMRRHELSVRGGESSRAKVDTWLEEICEGLKGQIRVPEKNDIDCVVCFTAVEDLAELYRLQVCGHAYCSDCINGLIRSNISSKDFPVVCATEGCGNKLAVRDFQLILKGPDSMRRLIDASVDSYMSQHNNEYKYCITANCSMIYKVTKTGKPFHCSECDVVICTTCQEEYHRGITCAMYKSMKRDPDYSLNDWIKQDPLNRSMCPKCETRIEKDGGCSHVHCSSCKAHICWLCKAVLATSGQCYNHIANVHSAS